MTTIQASITGTRSVTERKSKTTLATLEMTVKGAIANERKLSRNITYATGRAFDSITTINFIVDNKTVATAKANGDVYTVHYTDKKIKEESVTRSTSKDPSDKSKRDNGPDMNLISRHILAKLELIDSGSDSDDSEEKRALEEKKKELEKKTQEQDVKIAELEQKLAQAIALATANANAQTTDSTPA